MASVVAVALANTLLIVVPALALLAGLLIVGAASRSDRDEVIGHLSRETRRADRTEPRPVPDVASGREIEHRAEIERLSHGSGMATLVRAPRSEEHTSELQSLKRISYACLCFE